MHRSQSVNLRRLQRILSTVYSMCWDRIWPLINPLWEEDDGFSSCILGLEQIVQSFEPSVIMLTLQPGLFPTSCHTPWYDPYALIETHKVPFSICTRCTISITTCSTHFTLLSPYPTHAAELVTHSFVCHHNCSTRLSNNGANHDRAFESTVKCDEANRR